MRILSKFKDYYDGCQIHGADRTLVYARKEEAHKMRLPVAHYPERERRWESRDMRVRGCAGSIGFCGSFYGFLEVEVTPLPLGPAAIRTCAYTPEAAMALLQSVAPPPQNWYWKYGYDQRGRQRPLLEAVLADYQEEGGAFGVRAIPEPFIRLRAPILLPRRESPVHYDPTEIVETNVCLSTYQFYKVFDAFQTYQEISMFLGGVLPRSEQSTATISDEDMRDKKGFDAMSFKKYPTKKRRKK